MSSKKGRSGNKKNNRPIKHRRKKNLEEIWNPKPPTEPKKFWRQKRYYFHMPDPKEDSLSDKYKRESPTPHTSSPNPQYNPLESQSYY